MDNIYPSYLSLAESGELGRRAEALRALASPCRLCPRACGVNRAAGEKGYCRAGATARVASHNAHHGEEPPISGSRGSGTVFFAHCTMRCLFCQNYPISQLGHGAEANDEQLAEQFLALQRMGCHNLNLVTATHYANHVVAALALATAKGFRLPIVYNTSGYESLPALEILEGIIDIYMPDIKYVDPQKAARYSSTADYARYNLPALREMQRQVGDLECDDEGIARRGLLVRHLVLPGAEEDAIDALRALQERVSPRAAVSLMNQYFPAHKAPETPPLHRRVDSVLYSQAVDWVESTDLRGWIQT